MKALRALVAAQDAHLPCVLVQIVGVNGSTPRAGGARMLVYADGAIVGTIGGGELEHRLIAEALAALQEGRPRRFAAHLTRDLGMCCGGAVEAFVEPFLPPERLIILGGGHVGAATAMAAAPLGFEITVVDAREQWLEASRFPPGTTRLLAEPDTALDRLPLGPRTAVLVVTHAHALDQRLVEALLPRDLLWLGLIGSKAKVARFRLRLEAGGMDPALFARLQGPVGLDLGAETPEEIAISIVAELVWRRRGARNPPLPFSRAERGP